MFALESPYEPTGDQPKAIEELVSGLIRGDKAQTLLGITGSGKTFTVANVIAKTQRPALILAHNKTLAAQLYGEFKELFPNTAVHYFVSYYDYYQPEAYVPTTDTYIEKDSYINEEIDRMRHAATYALLSRRDVIIIASVSCIYGIGDPSLYARMTAKLTVGMSMDRDDLLRTLIELQYERNDIDFHRGTFRVRGDTVEVFPAYELDRAIRIEWWGDEIEGISEFDPLRGQSKSKLEETTIFPASHYATPQEQLKKAMKSIRKELTFELTKLSNAGKLLERQRLEQRTMYDLECIEQLGFCSGIENYSRHLTGRKAGEPPPTLIDYLPEDAILFVDESHQTIPQIRAMYRGDQSRKSTLVEHGFRMPSALDNRPLMFKEWEKRGSQKIFVSATPADYELEKSKGVIVEQIIRPTGLLDPIIEVRPVKEQVDNLLHEIRDRAEKQERVLVTTLTKRMAEDLTEYYADVGVRVQYMHSDIDTLERIAIIKNLRKGEFDVLVGINLLREGLDIPEVSLVAILDADKEGFLRSARSLIQTIGRAARNSKGRVLLYGDKMTDSMKTAIEATEKRRETQKLYNQKHGITPTTVSRSILSIGESSLQEDENKREIENNKIDLANIQSSEELADMAKEAKKQMKLAAKELRFEDAARWRDQAKQIEDIMIDLG